MRNTRHSKLIYFLATLSPTDRKSFREFLASPIFNKQEPPRLLFAFIEKHCLKEEINELDAQKAGQFIWKGKKATPSKLEKVKSRLLALFMEYLAFRNWQGDKQNHQIRQVEELIRMGEESYIDQYFRKAETGMDPQVGGPQETYLHRLQLAALQLSHAHLHQGRTTNNSLVPVLNALDAYILANVLKFAFIDANRARILGHKSEGIWCTRVVEELPYEFVQQQPFLEIYFLLNQTISKDSDPEYLDRLQELTIHATSGYDAQEMYDIFTGTINNFSRQKQLDDRDLLERLFHLYEAMIQVYAIGKDGGLVPWHVKNIVFIAARLGKFDWLDEFMDQVPALLRVTGEALETTMDYNLGVEQFYQGNFEGAIRHFHRVLPTARDIFYATDARAYLLMAFYETGDTLGMESLLHSFRMFISRGQKVSETHRKTYMTFMRLFRKALTIPRHEKLRLQELKAEIEGLSFSAGKLWLLQRIRA